MVSVWEIAFIPKSNVASKQNFWRTFKRHSSNPMYKEFPYDCSYVYSYKYLFKNLLGIASLTNVLGYYTMTK